MRPALRAAAPPGVRSVEGGGGGGGGAIRVIRPGSSSLPSVQSQVMNNSHQHTKKTLPCYATLTWSSLQMLFPRYTMDVLFFYHL